MKLVSPDFSNLFALPNEGAYQVVGFSSGGAWQRMPERSRPMSVEQYESFQAGRLLLHGLLAFEEAYDVAMGNYLDLEETVLRLSALEIAQRRPHGKDDHFDTARRSCHRALANLLSASKAFQDQSQKLASSIGGAASTNDLSALKASLNQAFDASLGYRFMSALRNHAQHHGVSVSGVSHAKLPSNAKDESQDQFVRTTPYILLTDLRQNRKFKASTLEEIEGVAEDGPRAGERMVPVIPLVRQYMAGLSLVMADIRRLYSDRERAALNIIYAAFYQYTGFFTQNYSVGLVVVPAEAIDGLVVYFGTDDHFKVQNLREVNGDLSMLPRTGIRQ
ncbi:MULTISPECIES: hypothetical protein [unclassified Bradyrhizobium]|uniref:hypothetical protein n=1 Tax=Bradyrhizobium sp. USDA 4541 TaxID=2817704 RepID=UPI0020A3B826|nr:hypothetical protein [Bradyrhizobium sp. USDA 4541]MCP1848107.1 hypothetical protein [Bradyrhizobium sp. USDA 4541]